MITLLTAAPGGGKTSEGVRLLTKEFAGRPIYNCGVNGLKVPHEVLERLEDWPTHVPDGAVVIVDEVQQHWRPMGPGQKVPLDIQALETHRHRGLDFILTTQGPNLVHGNVRALVGRHVHIRDVGLLGRWWYEWPECCDNPKVGWKTAPVKRRHKLDKSTFDLYKSASMHIKPVRSIPPVLYLLAALVLLLAGLIWYGVQSIGKKVDSVKHPPTGIPAVVPGASAPGLPYGPQPGGAPRVITAATLQRDFQPRIPTRPETAPAYDALRVVAVMPRIVGGYCQGERCRCYTQQFTDPGIGEDACRAWLRSPPFDPYHVPELAVRAPARPASAPLAVAAAGV